MKLSNNTQIADNFVRDLKRNGIKVSNFLALSNAIEKMMSPEGCGHNFKRPTKTFKSVHAVQENDKYDFYLLNSESVLENVPCIITKTFVYDDPMNFSLIKY